MKVIKRKKKTESEKERKVVNEEFVSQSMI